jgi:hypothetical protein
VSIDAHVAQRGANAANAALADLELAGERSRRTRTEMHLEAIARDRLPLTPPEWN